MLKRSMTRLAVALVGAGSVVSAAAVVGGTAHAVPANICVSANGTTYLAQGTAVCLTGAGEHSHAVGIGDGTTASAAGTNKNTAVALGSTSHSSVLRTNKSAAVVHGSTGAAGADGTNKNSAIATGACPAGPTGGNKQTHFCQ